jgi:protein-disulfide isomerase
MKQRILVFITLLTLQLSAVDKEGVHYYIKDYMEKKMHSPVDKIETISSYEIKDTNGWEVYFLSLDINIKMGSVTRKRTIPQIVFTKDNKIAFSLKDKFDQDYKKLLKPKVPDSAYDDAHLLVGNKDAEHKILVMSDPFCPYCQEIIPVLIDDVKKNPNKFALYYYHLPLVRIHPASDITTKAMHLFHEKGDVENMKKLYHLIVDPKERNAIAILDAIKKKTGVRIKLSEVHSEKVLNALAFDLAMKKRLMVTGTPTIFIDGTWDYTRMAYKKYLKK